MVLYPFSPTKLSYLDSGEFIVRYLTDVTNQGIDLAVDLDFKALHESIVSKSLIYNSALTQIRAKAESIELSDLDKNRDKKISTLRTAFNVSKNSDDANIKNAYSKIKIVFNAYKGIETTNYPAESLAITHFIAELRNATNLPFSQLLGLVPHIANLETANASFVAKFNTRSTDTISTQTYDTKLLRTEILATYKEMTNYVAVIAKIRNNDYYNTLLTTINYSRKYFANIIAGSTSDIPPPVLPVHPVV